MGIKDEFAFIEKLSPKNPLLESVIVGMGDDAAVVRPSLMMDTVVCKDTMVEYVHFKRETMQPYHIGFKALAANISDIAAMGALPTYYLVSIAIPKHWEEDELLEIYRGMETLASKYSISLIGGDTVSTDGPLIVTVTVLGEIERDKALKRSSAKPGDIVFLTGNVGDSAAGLHILLSDNTSNKYESLIERHQMPTPRVSAGRILQRFPRVAANDISDGVASEAKEIATASGVNIVLEENRLPLSKGIMTFGIEQAIHWALYGGEDYELIGTTSPDSFEEIKQEFLTINLPITCIGKVEQGSGSVFLTKKDEMVELKKAGYNHFK